MIILTLGAVDCWNHDGSYTTCSLPCAGGPDGVSSARQHHHLVQTTGLHPVISSPGGRIDQGVGGERNYRPAQTSAGRHPGLPTHATPLGDNLEADGGVRGGGIAEAVVAAAGRPLPALRSTIHCAAVSRSPGRPYHQFALTGTERHV